MNEANWWDKRPYRTCGHVAEHYCFCEDATYDIPAIIQAVREEERLLMRSALKLEEDICTKPYFSNPSP